MKSDRELKEIWRNDKSLKRKLLHTSPEEFESFMVFMENFVIIIGCIGFLTCVFGFFRDGVKNIYDFKIFIYFAIFGGMVYFCKKYPI